MTWPAPSAFGCRTADLLARTEHPAAYDCATLRLPRNPLLATLRFARFVLRYRRARKARSAAAAARDGRRTLHGLRPLRRALPRRRPSRRATSCTPIPRCIRCCALRERVSRGGAQLLAAPFAPVLSRLFRQRKPDVFSLGRDRTAFATPRRRELRALEALWGGLRCVRRTAF